MPDSARTLTPFILVADLRTGSTLLSSSLNRHPRIRCYGEILHADDFPDNRIDGLPDRRAASGSEIVGQALNVDGADAVGFKAMVFLPPPSVPQWSDAWSYLRGLDDLCVLYLTREDRLAQYTSLVMAQTTGVFHPYDNDALYDPSNRPTVTIDPDAFTAWTRERDALMEERRALLRGRPALEVTYETLTDAWAETTAEIQRFLGVDVQTLPKNKKKQETRPLSEVIANYDQVA